MSTSQHAAMWERLNHNPIRMLREITRARLNELIKGKRGITAESALDLAEALGTSAKLWMNLQATFDLDLAMKRREVA